MERDHNDNYGGDFGGSNPWNYDAGGSDDITSHEYLRKLSNDALEDYAESLTDNNEETISTARGEVIARLEHELPYLNHERPVHIDLTTSRYYINEPDVPFDAELSLRNLVQPDAVSDIDDSDSSGQLSGLFIGFDTLEQLDPNHRPDEFSIGLTIIDDRTLNATFVPLTTLLDNIIESEQD